MLIGWLEIKEYLTLVAEVTLTKFIHSGRIQVTDQSEKFFAFFCQNSGKSGKIWQQMFCTGDFDVKIARIWKIFARIFDTFWRQNSQKFSQGKWQLTSCCLLTQINIQVDSILK